MERDLNVLLVDDDEDEYFLLREMISRIPEGSYNLRLDWTPSFDKALEMCATNHYDVHLIDYHLGKYNGLDLMQAARALGCDVPSILLTGQGSYALDVEAMEQGVYDYLLKDQVNPGLLERAIRYALERHETEAELERRVRERTSELAAANERLAEANRDLKTEIARRSQVEKTLRESEARFRVLSDTTSAAIFIVQDGLIRYANPATRFVTGYAPEELVGTELWRLAHPAYQASIRDRRMVSIWSKDVPARYEIKLLYKGGGERWVDVTAGEIEYEDRPAQVFTAFDITERDMAEKALRKARDELEQRVIERTAEIQAARQRLETILRTLPVGLIIADQEGRIIDGNQAFRMLWGASGELPAVIQDWPILPAWVAETGKPIHIRDWLIEHTVRRGESILARMVDIRPSPENRSTILYSSVPIIGADGQVTGGVAVIQDITEQRRLEQRAQNSAQESQQRADELQGLQRATAALLTTLDLDELLPQILDAAQSAIPAAERGRLHLILPTTGQLQARAELGFKDRRVCVIRSPDGPGYAERVARERSPLLVPDVQAEPAEAPKRALAQAVSQEQTCDDPRDERSMILAPLYMGDHVLGTLSLSASRPGVFNESNLRLLASLAATTTAALQNAILHAEIKQLAVTDPLTGNFNRRAFFDLGQHELERYQHLNHFLAAIMIDLDNFKQINDTHGHVIGDQILRSLAVQVKENIRESDIFGRYGGDEFALLLPNTGREVAEGIAYRIRDAVANMPLPESESDLHVTVSLGVACASQRHRVLEDLLADADQALYLAKSSGRNRVEVLEPDKEEDTLGS